jgi:YdjC-like protein
MPSGPVFPVRRFSRRLHWNMMIVNADDWGRDRVATDTAWACYRRGRVSCVSAMVFMEDSERAAQLAKEAGLDVGLHVNFTERFSSPACPPAILAQQLRLLRFLKRSKYALLFYHPFLAGSFRRTFEAQLAEFLRLYGRAPSHFDGHQHMHLSTNMLVQRIIPAGEKVRRSFSFGPGEKSWLNRLYRQVVDRCLAKRYRVTDFFFALSQHPGPVQLAPLFTLARDSRVELMTHTWNQTEYDCLMSEGFRQLAERIEVGGYARL